MKKTKINYQYHHMGIPTSEPQLGEKYSSTFKMYTTDGNNEFHIQWHRFEKVAHCIRLFNQYRM